jgi:uncharacterized membrane protein YeaQ/YmgE (transglycosylase-associated protein family)
MDLTSILLNTVAGGAGGWLGDMLKKNGLGLVGNLIAGAVGGNGLPAILGAVAPSLLGGDSNMIVNLLVSLVGGSAGSLIGGLFKKAA